MNPFGFALVAMFGLLGLRVFEACGADISDLGEEHGHRVLRVGGKVVLVPLPPAVGRAIDRAVGDREHGPILLNRRGVRMDRHCATRRLRRLAEARHADPRTTMRYDRARKTSTGTRTTFWRRTWRPQPDTQRTVLPMTGRVVLKVSSSPRPPLWGAD
ncbi:hypothetical protein AB0M83_08920 [Amycolatopsis sp. NPDC051106]|uniref:hypothetical protein n=1 Tax=unclassified Amycolatopsis TaxID=2618356 RepID=UPI00343543B6